MRSSSGSSLVARKLCLELLKRRKSRVDRARATEILRPRPQVFGHLDARAIRRAQRLHRRLEQQVLADQLVEYDLVTDESRAIQVLGIELDLSREAGVVALAQ